MRCSRRSLLPAGAAAHPLGNFTVNRYAGIEVAGSSTYVQYALDLAEIPTYQLGAEVRAPGYASTLARRLELTLDGRPAPLRVLERRVTQRPGAGGLKTLRLDVVYVAAGSGENVRFRDLALPGRIGWREITVSARDGAKVVQSNAPSTSESQALTAYPKNLLRSPLDVTSVTAVVDPGDEPGAPPTIDAAPAPEHESGGFEALIEQGDISAGVLLVSLLIAAFWGAAHALTPGHGKALVAAYLVGTKGTPRHAFLLGGTVTIAHTAGVFAIGIVTLALSQFILPEQLYPWLTLVSGLLVVAVGAAVLRQRLRSRGATPVTITTITATIITAMTTATGTTTITITTTASPRRASSASELPPASCPARRRSSSCSRRSRCTASVSGLVLIVAFSVGLAATITGIGLVAVLARRAFGRLSLDGPLVRALPAVSAALILLVGVAITARALPGVL